MMRISPEEAAPVHSLLSLVRLASKHPLHSVSMAMLSASAGCAAPRVADTLLFVGRAAHANIVPPDGSHHAVLVHVEHQDMPGVDAMLQDRYTSRSAILADWRLLPSVRERVGRFCAAAQCTLCATSSLTVRSHAAHALRRAGRM